MQEAKLRSYAEVQPVQKIDIELVYIIDTNQISDHYRDYLIQQYGTADLTPLPSSDPNDLLNWPE
jgi:hypothetical protein